MPRADYDRFLEIAEGGLGEKFFLQTPKSDRECFYGGYSRLHYTNSTAIEVRNWGHHTNQGIWMDIQPLDYVMENQEKKMQFCDEMHEIQRLILAKVYSENNAFLDMSSEQFETYKKQTKRYDYDELQKKLKAKLVSIEQETHWTILASYHLGNYLSFPQCYFGVGKKLSFEGMEIMVPCEYKKILTKLYGCSYMGIPEVEQQVPKHEVFFNADRPYEEYIHRFMDIFEDAEQKSYVIVGTSELADTFIDKNHEQINIAFVVDNERVGDTFWGYPVKCVDEIHELPEDKRRVVICERYFKESETCLQQAAIEDYYIYIHEKWWLLGNNV
jgi:lipopolysaccharide cholinephosphotransferase